jgi:hypothetical protein
LSEAEKHLNEALATMRGSRRHTINSEMQAATIAAPRRFAKRRCEFVVSEPHLCRVRSSKPGDRQQAEAEILRFKELKAAVETQINLVPPSK